MKERERRSKVRKKKFLAENPRREKSEKEERRRRMPWNRQSWSNAK